MCDRTRSKFRFGIRVRPCACPTPGKCRAQKTYLPFQTKHDKTTRLTSTEKSAEFPLSLAQYQNIHTCQTSIHIYNQLPAYVYIHSNSSNLSLEQNIRATTKNLQRSESFYKTKILQQIKARKMGSGPVVDSCARLLPGGAKH